jgi:hypothetical protein
VVYLVVRPLGEAVGVLLLDTPSREYLSRVVEVERGGDYVEVAEAGAVESFGDASCVLDERPRVVVDLFFKIAVVRTRDPVADGSAASPGFLISTEYVLSVTAQRVLYNPSQNICFTIFVLAHVSNV